MKNWIKGKVSKFKNSRFFLFVIALVIGSAYTYVFLAGLPIYREMREGYAETTFMQIRTGKDGLVSTVPHQVNEPNEPKNSMESEIAPATSSPTVLSIADKIWQKETQKGRDLSGLHGKCVAQGLDNSYSYAPGKCYKNAEETRSKVVDWLERKTKNLSMTEALCLYGPDRDENGKTLKDCSYAQEIINLI